MASSPVPRLAGLLGAIIAAFLLLTPPVLAQTVSEDSTSLDEALATADSLRDAGNFREAEARLATLKEKHPNNARILWRLSYVQVYRGQVVEDESKQEALYENALQNAKAALEVDSTNAWAHVARAVAEGRLALDAGRRERVERSRAIKRHVDRAIALDSTLAEAYHVRGRWHREAADLNFFQRAVVETIYGGLPDASFEQSVRDLKRAIELEDRTFHRLELARTYLTMDRPDAARRELKRALELPRKDPFTPRYKEEARSLLNEMN